MIDPGMMLQLGHGFFSVEIMEWFCWFQRDVELQLGHGIFSVEIS